jgi:catechol 2,3-dioxygenase-like lactoylglutathione lyase family enzyme
MTLVSSTPVFRVSDYQRARAFWTDVLGFDAVEEAGDPVVGFGIFIRDRARVFLTAWDGPEAAYSGWRAYFHVTDIESIRSELTCSGTTFKGPVLTVYGMHEIEVADPDGNVVCFGQDAE